MSKKIAIVDYGMGNINSVKRKILQLGAEVIVTSNPEEILTADKIILPGVGHFSKAMESLRAHQLVEPLNKAVLENHTPILGICLGMQLMALSSEEGSVPGLGWFDATVVRFNVEDQLHFKIPHTGWNQVIWQKESPLEKGLTKESEFYFVHAFHLKTNNPEDNLNLTDYEYQFPSAISKGHIYGVQYHPEKSHDAGLQMLKNFIEI
ncbi:MAG: glutamine amidotransferase [Crocinitomicaceae bacterium]|jgi:glutamine amidotransferase